MSGVRCEGLLPWDCNNPDCPVHGAEPLDESSCPHCGSDAYHGVITEPDEFQRWACDECGYTSEGER
jgi:ribosomal protein S27AE